MRGYFHNERKYYIGRNIHSEQPSQLEQYTTLLTLQSDLKEIIQFYVLLAALPNTAEPIAQGF